MRRADSTSSVSAVRRPDHGSMLGGWISLLFAAMPLGVFVWAVLAVGGFFAA